MHKIGILTYHRVVNDGSIVQAYCLQKALMKHYPNSRVEIIDYVPKKLLITELKKAISKRPPFASSKTISKIKSVNNFISTKLIVSKDRCITDNLEKALKFIHKQSYDIIFVGSDTVWEARNSNYVPSIPNLYYLPNYNGKKVSFAASSDPVKPEILNKEKIMTSVKNNVSDFNVITVRDEMTKDYLVDLGIEEKLISFMPDPTFHFSIHDIVIKNNLKRGLKKPLAGIDVGGGIDRNKIIKQLKTLGYSVMDINRGELEGEKVKGLSQSVYKRLGLFSELDVLLTDRFHSSIFTLQLSKVPVIFIETSEKWPLPNSKGRDLFKRLKIIDMLWRYEGVIPDNLVETHLAKWKQLESICLAEIQKLKEYAELEFLNLLNKINKDE